MTFTFYTIEEQLMSEHVTTETRNGFVVATVTNITTGKSTSAQAQVGGLYGRSESSASALAVSKAAAKQ